MQHESPGSVPSHPLEAVRAVDTETVRETVPELSSVTIRQPEQSVLTLEQRTQHFGERRGEYLVRMLRYKEEDPERESLRQKISELDDNFSRFAERYHPVMLNDLHLLQRVATQARIAQDTVIYNGLKDRYFALGRDLGEAQGRVIDAAWVERTGTKLAELDARVKDGLRGIASLGTNLPDELASSNGPGTTLQSALRAAFSQGERVGIERRVAAEMDAVLIFRNISGWKHYLPTWVPFFKPFHVVHDILRGKDAEQLGYIDSALKGKMGVGISEALINAYGKNYGSRIRWLRDGDEIGGAALTAARVLGAFFSTARGRGERMREIYEAIPVNKIPHFEQLLARELRVPESNVQDYIAGKITVRAAQKLQALRDPVDKPDRRFMKEQAIHLADLLESSGGRQLEARWVLHSLKGPQLEAFSEMYHSQNGQSLRHALETRLPPSAAKDLCLAVMDQDSRRIAAAEIKCAFDYRADWIGAPFLRISREESLQKREAYNAVYHPDGKGDFWSDLKQAARKEDYFFLSKMPTLCGMLDKLSWPFTNSYPFLESIVLNGELTRAERLRYYMIGIGTDIDGIYAELSNLPVKEIKQTDEEYESRYHTGSFNRVIERIPVLKGFFLIGKLRHDLQVELSGDHEFDISLLLEGLPDEGDERQLCQTKLDHLHRRYHHERSGVLLKNGSLTRWRGDGTILKAFHEDYRNAVDYYMEHLNHDGQLAPEHIKRFCTLVRLAETHADAYRDAKITVSTLVLNSGAFIGATVGAAGVFLISALPWWSAGVAAGIGSLCWRWAQGNLLLGRGFGKTDATFQAIRAFIDGASLFTVRIGVATLSGLVGQQISSNVAKGGFKTSLHKFIESIENSIKRQDKARHLIEKGTVVASDDELHALTDGFYEEIKANSAAISSEKLSAGRRIEDAFLRCMIDRR